MRASLFVTCLIDMFQPEVGVATVKVLRAAGCQVSFPAGQTCCGQPAWNSGFADDAAKVAKNTLEALEGDQSDVVVVPAGSCATMIRVFWPEMFEVAGEHKLADRARKLGLKVRELTEFLAEREAAGFSVASELQNPPEVAYHHSCHMLRELSISDQPEALLASAGCSKAEWPDATRCCGFGGLFSMKLPETSVAMADEKLRSIPESAEVLVGSDGSCLMHLRGRLENQGRFLPVRHIAELLADAVDQHASDSDGHSTASGSSRAQA